MDENREAALRRYFSIISVVFFTIYIVCMMISLFSISVPTPVLICLIFVAFSLFIIQDDVSTKAEEVGDISRSRFLSLPFVTNIIALCYALMVYLQIKQQYDFLWVVIAQFDSTLLDTSLRALRKLKENEG